MGRIMKLTQEYVRSILYYDPESGMFMWRIRPDVHARWNVRYAGQPAGKIAKGSGYHEFEIHKVKQYGHRIAWLYHCGPIPDGAEVDHINGDRSDNRICNLRIADRKQNMANMRKYKANGLPKGVGFDARYGTYTARARSNNRTYHLGTFKTAEAAHEAYMEAMRKHFGAFARSS